MQGDLNVEIVDIYYWYRFDLVNSVDTYLMLKSYLHYSTKVTIDEYIGVLLFVIWFTTLKHYQFNLFKEKFI